MSLARGARECGSAEILGNGLILCCRAKEQDPGSYTKGEPGAPPHPLSPIRLEGEEKSTGLPFAAQGKEDPPLQLPALGLWRRVSSYANAKLAHCLFMAS